MALKYQSLCPDLSSVSPFKGSWPAFHWHPVPTGKHVHITGTRCVVTCNPSLSPPLSAEEHSDSASHSYCPLPTLELSSGWWGKNGRDGNGIFIRKSQGLLRMPKGGGEKRKLPSWKRIFREYSWNVGSRVREWGLSGAGMRCEQKKWVMGFLRSSAEGYKFNLLIFFRRRRQKF